nr:UbiD family decarboxylase domain-containing protein [Desulforamulus aquiferis]
MMGYITDHCLKENLLMIYKSMKECIIDLERHGHLVRIKEEVDPNLEMAEIHRRVYQRGGPAILYERVKGSPFPAVSNIFGTLERARFIFRNTLDKVMKLMQVPANPMAIIRRPWEYAGLSMTGLTALPKKLVLARYFMDKQLSANCPR